MKKKTGLNGYVYDFSVDYDTMAIDDIYIYINWWYIYIYVYIYINWWYINWWYI